MSYITTQNYSSPVPPSSSAGFPASGTPGALSESQALFHRFHAFPAQQVKRELCRRLMPEVLVHLGELSGLVYRSDKAQRGRPQSYIHFFQQPAQLACDPQGKQLYILGGNYRVTGRGIEG